MVVRLHGDGRLFKRKRLFGRLWYFLGTIKTDYSIFQTPHYSLPGPLQSEEVYAWPKLQAGQGGPLFRGLPVLLPVGAGHGALRSGVPGGAAQGPAPPGDGRQTAGGQGEAEGQGGPTQRGKCHLNCLRVLSKSFRQILYSGIFSRGKFLQFPRIESNPRKFLSLKILKDWVQERQTFVFYWFHENSSSKNCEFDLAIHWQIM